VWSKKSIVDRPFGFKPIRGISAAKQYPRASAATFIAYSRRRRKTSVEQLADEAAARLAISGLRLELNRGGAWYDRVESEMQFP
jgi:hypothetical protein